MSNILTIAYSVEGNTDKRFLENIIQRTFEEVAFECDGDIDVYPIVHIPGPKKNTFVDNIVEIAVRSFDSGINVLCIHTDADDVNNTAALKHKIRPAFDAVTNLKIDACKNLVALIPIQMSEAWMLADKELFKEEIEATQTNAELGIAKSPEKITDPKKVIEDALRIAQKEKPKKRQKNDISTLYQPLGQKIAIKELEHLDSYNEFRANVVEAFRTLNYLH